MTDSSPTGVLKTRMIIDWLKKREDNGGDEMSIIAIANKQDLPGAMKAKRVEDVLHVPTYPMVAIDTQYREELLELIINEFKRLI